MKGRIDRSSVLILEKVSPNLARESKLLLLPTQLENVQQVLTAPSLHLFILL